MKTFIIFVMLSAVASGQEFGPTADPVFQQSLRPDEPLIVPHTERLQAVKELSVQLATEESDPHSNYVVMFTADYCGSCQTMKHAVIPIVECEVGKVRIVDVQKETQWQVRTLPTFWIADRCTQTQIAPAIVGVCSADTLIQAVKTRTRTVATDNKTKTVTRKVPMTHADMVQLHDSLHGGGYHWAWTGNLRDHLRTVHGIDID